MTVQLGAHKTSPQSPNPNPNANNDPTNLRDQNDRGRSDPRVADKSRQVPAPANRQAPGFRSTAPRNMADPTDVPLTPAEKIRKVIADLERSMKGNAANAGRIDAVIVAGAVQELKQIADRL